MEVSLPELLAGDIPIKIPGDTLGANEGEYVGVVMVSQLQEPSHQRHTAQPLEMCLINPTLMEEFTNYFI